MSAAPRTVAAGLFFLSGALGLVYEVVWTRQLVLLVGATTPAVSAVLSVFMAGLAAGAWLFGRRADRSPAPLKLYALLEAGVGVYALGLPLLMPWITLGYVQVAQALGEEPALLGIWRVFTALVLLGVPCVLMGGTFPALLRVAAREPRRVGVDLGRLYAANLLGAVAGTLAAAFALIGTLGLRGTTALAALGNLSIALVAFVWPDRGAGAASQARPTPAGPPLATPTARAPPDGVLFAILGLSGFLTMAYEVLWTRILVFSFQSTVYGFAVILATFLLGLMLGSAAFARLERRLSPGLVTLCAVQIAAALLALGLAPLGARVEDVVLALSQRFGFSGGTFLAATALAAGLLMLVPAALMGVVFPLASRLLIRDVAAAGQTLGRAYWINTAGAVLGSLAAGFVLVPALGLRDALMLLAGLQALAGGVPLLWGPGPPARRRVAAAASALALTAALALLSRTLTGPAPFDPIAGLVEAHHDDATASVSVVLRPGGGRSLRIDGFEAASADERSGYMALMAHLPMLLHPRPERALVVCFGTGTTAGAVLRYPDVRLDVVDLNRTVFAFAHRFSAFNHDVARDPRARLVLDDGRNFLLTTAERYDVITAEPMPPTFAGVASLYSREYYQLARERLRPGGLVVQWLPFQLVTEAEAWSILRTVQDVLPDTSLWVHEGTGIIVARRDGPLAIDLDRLRRRFAEVAPELRRFGAADVGAFLDGFALGPIGVGALAQGAPPITDDRPSLEFGLPRHRAQLQWGVYNPEQMRALLRVHALRAVDPLPLVGATASEVAEVEQRRRTDRHALLGDVYLGAGFADEARAQYVQGLATRPTRPQRALFLFALAQIAQARGQASEALVLVDEGLALWPDNAGALRLRAELLPTPPAS